MCGVFVKASSQHFEELEKFCLKVNGLLKRNKLVMIPGEKK
jgi:hypothetical protein